MTTATMQPARTDSSTAKPIAAAPVRRKAGRPRSSLETAAKRRAFLKTICIVGEIKKAARIVGISASAHRYWMKSERYRQAFAKAQKRYVRRIEDEAIRRALEGTQQWLIGPDGQPLLDEITGRPKFRLIHSDLMLCRLLAAHDPFYGRLSGFGRVTSRELENIEEFARRWPEHLERHRERLMVLLLTGRPMLPESAEIRPPKGFTFWDEIPSVRQSADQQSDGNRNNQVEK
ncbi:hypothetical protein [Planctellipticum variicoloris]|uniref:hypothetical protein n=1 Tax=Planctellipticum variicoloris TaxID=3064265 RepID=UPI00301408A3|nr:hypothetical protein SH412_000955 [Planctomycetaceae bacterium SH412]